MGQAGVWKADTGLEINEYIFPLQPVCQVYLFKKSWSSLPKTRGYFLHNSLSLLFVSHLLSELLGCTLVAFEMAMLINCVVYLPPLWLYWCPFLSVLSGWSCCVVFWTSQPQRPWEVQNVPAWFMAIRLDPDLDGHQHWWLDLQWFTLISTHKYKINLKPPQTKPPQILFQSAAPISIHKPLKITWNDDEVIIA